MTTAYITANEMQLKLLVEFCRINQISLEIPEALPVLKADTSFRTPSHAVKQFCGSEMMTSRGKMQPSAALDYIMIYAKRHNLLNSTSIVMDESLRDIFNRYSSIPCTELPMLVNGLFSD
jgi:hypothetical protein